ncbi:DUF3575 domain-containing protein [Dysgonomonas sp.]|jgi:hypothetical protein
MNISQILRKVSLIAAIITGFCASGKAQEVAIKTNLAYWATTTPNLGMEFALGKKSTLEISGGLNPFEFSDNKRFKHWLIQPEYRWWFCEAFNGHFLGVHAHGAQFNVGGWDIPLGRLDVFKDRRYEGYLYGGGISYGYQWVLSNRWNFEFNIGAGYARIHYDEYPCKDCGTKLDESNYNYWGITRVGLSFIYFIK